MVIDGASTDGTQKLLENVREIRCTWISEPDSGIYDAFNKGVQRAKGEWLLFLGADDKLADENALKRSIDWLDTLPPDVLWCYGELVYHGPTSDERWGAPWEKIKSKFCNAANMVGVPHPATFHRKALFKAIGMFDASYRIAGDYDLLLRAVISGYEPTYASITVSEMSCVGVSSRPENSLLCSRECCIAWRNATQRNAVPIPLAWGYLKSLIKVYFHFVFGERALGYFRDFYRIMTGRKPMWSLSLRNRERYIR